jgi:hypothetical protein
MKKRIALYICCVMILNLACACSSKTESTTKKTKKTKVSKATTEATDVIDDTDDTDVPDDTVAPKKAPKDTTQATTTALAKQVSVQLNDTQQINWVEVKDPYGYTSIKVPDTWQVEFILTDLIGYGLIAHDTTCPDRIFVFKLLASPFLKSKAAHDFWSKNAYGDYMGGTNDFVKNPYLTSPTTEGFFTECAPDYLTMPNFSKIAVLEENNAIFGDLLEGTCTSPNGNPITGVFGGSVWNTIDYPMNGIDCGWYSVSNVLVMAAPEEDYTNWIPVMTEMFNSIYFSEQFMQDRNREWAQIIGTSQYLSKMADQMGDMIMDTWNKSMETYDILSQMRSDSTLGRERVVDNETGEIYYAPNGFSGEYDGTRYSPLSENDPRYRDPVVGTLTYD